MALDFLQVFAAINSATINISILIELASEMSSSQGISDLAPMLSILLAWQIPRAYFPGNFGANKIRDSRDRWPLSMCVTLDII